MARKILRFLLFLGLLLPSLSTRAASVPVVARVGTTEIKATELEEAVEEAINSSYYHRKLPDSAYLELKKKELRRLIRQHLDYLGAVDHALHPEPLKVEAQRAEVERRLGKEEYERSLRARGWTPDDHRKVIERNLLAEDAHRRFITEKSRVSDAELRSMWAANPERWVMPPSLHLLHILLKVDARASEETWKKREKEALALRKRAESGEDFGTLAAAHSEDMYRIRGGDLGWVHRGRLLKVLKEPVWNTEPGEIVGPLRSREGFHLVKVIARRKEKRLDFEEAEPMLRKEAEEEALSRAEKQWYGETKARHPVVILSPDLADIEV